MYWSYIFLLLTHRYVLWKSCTCISLPENDQTKWYLRCTSGIVWDLASVVTMIHFLSIRFKPRLVNGIFSSQNVFFMIMHGELILIGEHIYPVHDTRMLKKLLKYSNDMEKLWSSSPAFVYLEAPSCRTLFIWLYLHLWCSDAIWWLKWWTILAQEIACCLMAPSH